jgi:hypothetical protein
LQKWLKFEGVSEITPKKIKPKHQIHRCIQTSNPPRPSRRRQVHRCCPCRNLWASRVRATGERQREGERYPPIAMPTLPPPSAATSEIPPPMPESLSIPGQSNQRERETSERDRERARDTRPPPCPRHRNPAPHAEISRHRRSKQPEREGDE